MSRSTSLAPIITRVEGEPALTEARALLDEYLDWVIDATRTAGLDPETLRAHYYADRVLPEGCGLLARIEGKAVGFVGYDRTDATACEMKRLYVRESARGSGVAHALVSRLIEEARAAGYKRMCLETRAFMNGAIALYESLGFRDAPPFHDIPGSFRAATRFMERDL